MITKEFIIAIHTKLILQFGGTDGVRDEGLLESLIARPTNLKAYSKDPTVFDISANIAYGLIINHPFVDGNKRIGALMCELTIMKSGYVITASEEEKYLIYMQIAAGQMSEEELAIWLKKNSDKQ